jgi:hypothetical protein
MWAIFRDIACLFFDSDKEYIAAMLYGHGCFQEISIGILIVRSLLTIINLNKLEMHDLLRDTGREIAREMSPDQENTAEFSFPRMCRMSSTLGW